MSRKLEKYLEDKRDDLDVESPDDSLIWGGIERHLNDRGADNGRKTMRVKIIRFRNIAAIIIIVFTLGYLTNDIISKRTRPQQVTLSSISSELGRQEMQYMATVSLKTEEVRSFSHSQDSVIRQLFGEIKNLDAIYNQSMKDLRELGPDERVINTIFATYEQKIRLLELIILETNKTESYEKVEKNRDDKKTAI